MPKQNLNVMRNVQNALKENMEASIVALKCSVKRRKMNYNYNLRILRLWMSTTEMMIAKTHLSCHNMSPFSKNKLPFSPLALSRDSLTIYRATCIVFSLRMTKMKSQRKEKRWN